MNYASNNIQAHIIHLFRSSTFCFGSQREWVYCQNWICTGIITKQVQHRDEVLFVKGIPHDQSMNFITLNSFDFISRPKFLLYSLMSKIFKKRILWKYHLSKFSSLRPNYVNYIIRYGSWNCHRMPAASSILLAGKFQW